MRMLQAEDTQQPLKPYEKRDTLRQFLDHDGHVLRFYCIWDDRQNNEFGDVRQVANISLTRFPRF